MRPATHPSLPPSLSVPTRTAEPTGVSRLGSVRSAGGVARRAWRTAYVRRLLAGDALCALAAGAVGYLGWYGSTSPASSPTSVVITACLPVVWVVGLVIARTYEERFLWEGPEEFRRVFFAAAVLLAVVAAVCWGAQLAVARGFVVLALPLATTFTLGHRFAWRRWLHRQRERGRLLQTTLLVGPPDGVAALTEQIARHVRRNGYRVVGCCTPASARRDRLPEGVPALGTFDDVVDVVRRFDVDTVAVLASSEFEGARLRQLGWDLEQTRAELLLTPAVSEIAGPRVRIRPVWGLPLIHMERPELRGVRRLTKEITDRTLAVLALLVMLPVLLAIAVAVKATSPGPVLYRQERVGRYGRAFGMLKFRSMVTGADALLATLTADGGNTVLFKMKCDPRVTRIGRFLRRYSLDELPQLVNVVKGEMSLVGPRPPLPAEVERYGREMHRRFLVKPGLTGLWQVSGRSDLSWEESVRIDLRYVENWSLTFDLMIMCKTVKAILRGSGAY